MPSLRRSPRPARTPTPAPAPRSATRRTKLGAPTEPVELWTMTDLIEFLPWGRSTVYQLTRADWFPSALRLRGPRGTQRVWLAEEVRSWALCAPRDREPARDDSEPRPRTGLRDREIGESNHRGGRDHAGPDADAPQVRGRRAP